MSDGQFVVLLVPSTKNQSSLVNSPDEEKLKWHDISKSVYSSGFIFAILLFGNLFFYSVRAKYF